jgi:IS5 family transposase
MSPSTTSGRHWPCSATATSRLTSSPRVPQLGLEFELQLAQLDRLLDDDQNFRRVRDDLSRRYPLTRVHGRNSTPVEVILRMLVVMRL